MSNHLDDWVALSTRFTPGWPWPEESFGLSPMFGEDGWCRSCGTSTRPQSGALIMQGRRFPNAPVWMPNWLFDVVCVNRGLAEQVAEQFSVELREVRKPRRREAAAMQLIPAVALESWYEPADLATAIHARHARHNGQVTGSRCPSCRTWKWLPVSEGESPVRSHALTTGADLIASPEVFGDGLTSFRHLLFRRPFGEFLVGAHPRAWSAVEVPASLQ